jgi:hypothetical protein
LLGESLNKDELDMVKRYTDSIPVLPQNIERFERRYVVDDHRIDRKMLSNCVKQALSLVLGDEPGKLGGGLVLHQADSRSQG